MKKKRNTKSRVSDILITLLCLGGAALNFYFFWINFNTVLTKDEIPVATVTWKKKTSQRRFSERMVWDRLQQNAAIYNGDTIRTSADAETTVTFANSEIELGGNTIIQIQVDEEGITSVDFSGGTVSATMGSTTSGGGMRLKSGNVTVNLKEGATLSAKTQSSLEQNQDIPLQLQVTGGEATITDTTGSRSIQQGQAFSIAQDGSIQPKMITVTNPQPQSRALNYSSATLPVEFQWSVQNLPQNARIIFETATDKQFTDIQEQIALSGLSSMTIDCPSGFVYWRFYASRSGEIIEGSIAEGRIEILDAPTPSLVVPQQDDVFYYRTKQPSLRFMWNGNEYASRYRFEVADNPQMNNPVISQQSTYPSSIVSSLTHGTWYWQVTPYYTIGGTGYGEPSKVASFVIEKKAELEAPIPIAPANGGFVNIVSEGSEGTEKNISNSQTLFSWERENDAANYTVTVASDESMRNEIISTTVQENYASITLPSTGRWYWQVLQTDTEGNTSNTSAVHTFMAVDREIIFQTLFPPEGYSVAQSRLQDTRFTWKNNIPDKIKFQISKDKNFATLAYEETLSAESLSTTGRKLSVGDWYWRISTGIEGGQIVSSSPHLLRILPSLDKPVFATPVAYENVIVKPNQLVPFEWKSVTGADYYQVNIYIEDGTEHNLQEPVYQNMFVEGTSVETLFNELPEGLYRWTVQAFAEETTMQSRRTGLLQESYFNLIKIYPIELNSPANEEVFAGLDAYLNPTNATYTSRSPVVQTELIIAKNNQNALPKTFGGTVPPYLATDIIYRQTFDGSSHKLPALSAGTYWYTINAQTFEQQDISSTQGNRFRVLPIEPFPSPQVVAPVSNTVFDERYLINDQSITLSWNQIENAEAYLLVVQNTDTNTVVLETYIDAPSDKTRTINRTLDLRELGVGSYKWQVTAKRYLSGKSGLAYKDREILQDGIASDATFIVKLPQEEIYVYDPGDLYGN